MGLLYTVGVRIFGGHVLRLPVARRLFGICT